MTELEDELLRFPKGEHDDLIDALDMVPQIWQEVPRVERIPEREVGCDAIGW